MEQLSLFDIKQVKIKEPIKNKKITKRIEVEITKRYDTKAIISYFFEVSEEQIKADLTDYFERVKGILGIKAYKFMNIEVYQEE